MDEIWKVEYYARRTEYPTLTIFLCTGSIYVNCVFLEDALLIAKDRLRVMFPQKHTDIVITAVTDATNENVAEKGETKNGECL